MNLHAANLAAGGVLLFAMALILARAFRGPTLYDRILAVNVLGTKAAILIALIGFLQKRPEFIDISLVYAIINFVSTIAILRLIEFRRLT